MCSGEIAAALMHSLPGRDSDVRRSSMSRVPGLDAHQLPRETRCAPDA